MKTKAPKVSREVFDPAYIKACKRKLTIEEFAIEVGMKPLSAQARVKELYDALVSKAKVFTDETFPTLKDSPRASKKPDPAARANSILALLAADDEEEDAEGESEVDAEEEGSELETANV